MEYVEGDFIVEMETCYKHGELLAMRCRQCEIEMFSENVTKKVFGEEVVVVGDRAKEELVMLAQEYLESLDWAAVYTSKTKEVFDAGSALAEAVIKYFKDPGPFPGKLVPLEQIEEDIKKAQEEPETTVRPAKKEDFKPNAWHKPGLDDV